MAIVSRRSSTNRNSRFGLLERAVQESPRLRALVGACVLVRQDCRDAAGRRETSQSPASRSNAAYAKYSVGR